MISFLDRLHQVVFGRNTKYTSKAVIVEQINEPRPLPLGAKEFDEWAARIISGSLVQADYDSQVFTLANMIMMLGPHESHKPDAYFIHSLRKVAANQVADAKRQSIREAKKAEIVKKEAEEAAKGQAANPQLEATLERAKGLSLVKAAVLGDKEVQVPSE
jgi:hypothetical protein